MLQGTSMATPHVTGALALLLSRGLARQQAVDTLLGTANKQAASWCGCAGRPWTSGAAVAATGTGPDRRRRRRHHDPPASSAPTTARPAPRRRRSPVGPRPRPARGGAAEFGRPRQRQCAARLGQPDDHVGQGTGGSQRGAQRWSRTRASTAAWISGGNYRGRTGRSASSLQLAQRKLGVEGLSFPVCLIAIAKAI